MLLVITSIWTRVNYSTAILGPSDFDSTSLAIDTSDLFDPGMSILDSKVTATDTESNSFTDRELTSNFNCFTYNVPSKAKSRIRRENGRCINPINSGTKPQTPTEGETKKAPTSHDNSDFQTPNEDRYVPTNSQSEEKPEKEPEGLPTNFITIDPSVECPKYLRGLLKYAVCDDSNPFHRFFSPQPLLYLNAPFWTLLYSTLGRLIHHHEFRTNDLKLINLLYRNSGLISRTGITHLSSSWQPSLVLQ